MSRLIIVCMGHCFRYESIQIVQHFCIHYGWRSSIWRRPPPQKHVCCCFHAYVYPNKSDTLSIAWIEVLVLVTGWSIQSNGRTTHSDINLPWFEWFRMKQALECHLMFIRKCQYVWHMTQPKFRCSLNLLRLSSVLTDFVWYFDINRIEKINVH